MLHLLDEALEEFLRAVVPLPSHEYAISFDAPDKGWAAGRAASTPTLNAYLREVRPNTALRESGLEPGEVDGSAVLRRPLPLVDCRYLLTVWAEDVGNEHQTLGQVLVALLEHAVLPPEYLPPPMAHLRPLPRLVLRGGQSGEDSDFWSALGGQLKPGLDLVLTAPVEAVVAQRPAHRVDRYVLRTGSTEGTHISERDVPPPEGASGEDDATG
ncbi:Pvc16 family protein [Thalassiella azotivora]